MNIEILKDQKTRGYSPRDLYPVMREILLRDDKYDQNKEHFWCVALARNTMLQYVELISPGPLYQTVVEPMDVFSWAIHKQAEMLVLVHSHPSGELKPTPADFDLTDNLIQVGRVVRIPVVDHLIITTEGFYSFEGSGDIRRLNESKKYAPAYLESERIQKDGQRIGEEKGERKGVKKGKKEGIKEGRMEGRKEERIEMAKISLEEGLSIELIMKLTGLTKDEIEKL